MEGPGPVIVGRRRRIEAFDQVALIVAAKDRQGAEAVGADAVATQADDVVAGAHPHHRAAGRRPPRRIAGDAPGFERRDRRRRGAVVNPEMRNRDDQGHRQKGQDELELRDPGAHHHHQFVMARQGDQGEQHRDQDTERDQPRGDQGQAQPAIAPQARHPVRAGNNLAALGHDVEQQHQHGEPAEDKGEAACEQAAHIAHENGHQSLIPQRRGSAAKRPPNSASRSMKRSTGLARPPRLVRRNRMPPPAPNRARGAHSPSQGDIVPRAAEQTLETI